MEDLNAQQIVLLTLLVSFVTSIATGITTVSLLEQAPEPVTQTINRVVEKTVERVVEVEGEAPVERIVETVVVNAEDLTVEAVAKNSANIVRIYNEVGDLKTFIGLGILVSTDGTVLADSRNIAAGGNYVGEFAAGTFDLNVDFREANNPFALLKAQPGEFTEGEVAPTFSSATFANSQNVQLAQSVISISGQTGNIVVTGIITSLDPGETELSSINTSVDGSKVLIGSVLINLSGEIIGVKINGDPAARSSFMPANQVRTFLAEQSTAS